mmetsp:Transcript_112117/g.362109  ORF Transcript_112117/g.362109 Transcript_112117/m.362109 type:complete len:365 (+) Transcript_112117:32-1126(+)
MSLVCAALLGSIPCGEPSRFTFSRVSGQWPSSIAIICRDPGYSTYRLQQFAFPQRADFRPRIVFLSIIGDGRQFKQHLGRSSIYRQRASSKHRWLLVNGTDRQHLAPYIASLRARAERESSSDLLLFLHPDLYLPDTFEEELLLSVQRLNHIDPNWAVAGFFGVPLDWSPEPSSPWSRPRVVGRGGDHYGRYTMGWSNVTAAQCVDETALLLRTRRGQFGGAGASPGFDAALPSASRIWLGGTGTVLEGLAQGRRSYVLGVDVLHQMKDILDSPSEDRHRFIDERRWQAMHKFSSAGSTIMHATAMSYMSEKYLRSKRVDLKRVFAQNCDFGPTSWRDEMAALEGPVPLDPVWLQLALMQRAPR